MPLDVKRVAPELEQATHVFVGRVTAVEPPAASEPSSFRRSRVTFAVARRWKGPEGPSYTVAAGPLSVADTCVARFTTGGTYLVFAFAGHAASCRVWKQGGDPPFAAVGSIADMKAVVEELDRLRKRSK